MGDIVSDDDDLVDRSLDVSPEMDEGSDEELEEEREVEASQMQASNDDLMGHDTSREEGGDKENEPLASDEEDEGALIAGTDSAPATFSSPSRAVSNLAFTRGYNPLIILNFARCGDLWQRNTTRLKQITGRQIAGESLAESPCPVSAAQLFAVHLEASLRP